MVASGASNLFLGRDTKVFIKKGANIWQIPVLNGFAFNQSTNTSTITLEEMAALTGATRRGQKMFNDSVSPTEWSMDVYARPYISATKHRSVDEVLWASLAATNPVFTPATPLWSQAITYGTTLTMDVDFTNSNYVSLGTFDIYFVLGAANVTGFNYTATGDTTIYRIPNAVVNECTTPFDVNGITTISWSGMGGSLVEETLFDATGAIVTGQSQTNNFIRSRFTALAATSSISGGSITYGITLTGGSITISNNINFLTPEELGKVNQPIAHVAGTRSVTGSFSCYMDELTNGPIDLYEDIFGATGTVTNSFALDFYIGGKDAGGDRPTGPGLQFKIPNAHLEVPYQAPLVALTKFQE